MPEDFMSPDRIHWLLENQAIEELDRLNGVKGIAKQLGVSLATGEKLNETTTMYGKNVMPEKKPPNIFQFMWAAYQDKTLVLLTAAALVSLAIGIYEQIE